MRKYLVAVLVAALFLAPSVQLAHASPGDSYVGAGLSGGSTGMGLTMSAGTKLAPNLGVALDYQNYGANAGHGVTGQLLGYLPIDNGVSVFAGAGLSQQSMPGVSGGGVAYTVGMQSESADILIRLSVMQSQINGTATVNAAAFTIGRKF